MELKPIVTNFGEESLFQDLSKDVERRLPQVQVHWNRTHGREAKTVNIKATFTKFNSDQLGVITDGTVTKQPFLHLYWTSCMEYDEFRNGVKQRIMNWQENLKARDITDWLIIHVVYNDKSNTTKSKISLTRNNVYDRIKNDLCSKDGTRVAQFWEPKKEDLFTKSRDSWTTLLSQLRKLLLESISKHLMKFEKKVRLHREKYSDPSWSFIDYLKLNEELATIYKSVTLHNDALVQYDELDALFSQFVVNGQIKGIPPWMNQFTKTPSCWDGVSLNRSAVKYFRDAVYEGRASLIELRNYIFIRQWQMLINTQKNWDAAHRLLEFLFTVVNEMKILKTGLSYCIPACWVVACCLEYTMHSVENKEISTHSVIASLAQVLDYGREKLFWLGKECRLLPGQEPAQELVKEIISGLCKSQTVKEGDKVGSRLLMNALSFQTHFDKLYLYLCGRTKSLFSAVGRVRFANRVGIDMARYYMMKRTYGDAETQLLAAQSEFGRSKWTSLYIDILEPLAACQAELESFDNYLRTLASLSCSETLSFDKRLFYAEEFLQSVRHKAKMPCTTPTDPILTLEDVKIDLIKGIGHIGETINVILTLRNNLLKEIQVDEIEVRMQFTETDKVRLSSAEDEYDGLPRNSDRMNWSELFNEKIESSSPSVQKVGILQRIKTRRIVKQKETENRDIVESKPEITPSSHHNEISKTLPSQFFANGFPLAADEPKTLAEIAKGLPRALSISDESEGRNLEKSSEPIAIPNGGIQGRSDSTSSTLSAVSISSSTEASSLTDKENSAQKGIRQNVVSPLALNRNSNLNMSPEGDPVDEISNDSVFNREGGEVQFTLGSGSLEPQPEMSYEEKDDLRGELTFGVGNNRSEYEDRDEDDFENGMEVDNGVSEEKRSSTGFNLVSEKLEDNFEEDIPEADVAAEQGVQNKAVDDCAEEFEEPFLIEEEIEILPTKSLLSGPTLLAPGRNTVIVKAKVLHTGRYNLQKLLCRIGKVFLYNILALPRLSRAFFVVSDPPKFSWASNHIAECLLLGSKQRIHVTLSNGPGYIHASSVIQLSSSTGLQFSPVPPSSVMIYSANKKEEPKEGAMHIELNGSNKTEAYMYLPKCGPYEKVDMYFDVYAPVENADLFDHLTKHEVSLKCLWLLELVAAETKLESLFYEPFTLENENLFSTNGNYLRTTLVSLNLLQINIIDPQLHCLNSENFSFSCLTSDVQMTVQANEDLNLIWHVQEIDKEKQSPQVLICRLTVNFRTEDGGDTGEFSKQFEVTNINQAILSVSTSIKIEPESSVYKGSSYTFDVSIKEANKLPVGYENGLVVCTLLDNDQWKYDDDVKSRQYELKYDGEEFHFSFTTKAIPCVSGFLRHPLVVLSKVLEVPPDDSQDEPSHVRTHHVASGLSKTRLSSSRRTSAGATGEECFPFSPGEVIFLCAGQYISVLQPMKQVSVL